MDDACCRTERERKLSFAGVYKLEECCTHPAFNTRKYVRYSFYYPSSRCGYPEISRQELISGRFTSDQMDATRHLRGTTYI